MSRSEIESSGLVDQWISSSDSWLRSNTNSTKYTAISMICEIWVTFPSAFDGLPEMPNNIVKLLKNNLRDGTHI